MKTTPCTIADVLLLEPKVFGDDRGFFFESFNRREFAKLTRRDVDFVQDNHSRSSKNVLRGLHYKIQQPQGKLVRVVQGIVFDVAVDIRKSSPTFGQYVGVELSAENKRLFWVPEGFARGGDVDEEPFDVECLKRLLSGGEFVAFACDFFQAENDTRIDGKGIDHVNHAPGSFQRHADRFAADRNGA